MAGTRNVSNIFIENLENTYSHLINLYVRRCLGKNCGTYILYSNVAIFKEQYIFFCYMAESASWQAVLIGYPSKEDEPILPALNFQHWSCNKKVFSGHIINPLLT